jgi:flagellar assembly protein FliH
MNSQSSTSENTASLIDKLLEAKDPATIGLRRIIRKKIEDINDFPLKKVQFEEFDSPERKRKILSEDEKRIIELEKQITQFNIRLKKQQEDARKSVREAFEKGKAEGLRLGTEKGTAEAAAVYKNNIGEIQQNVVSFLKKIEDSKREIFSHSEHIILKLCLEISKKIIASEISTRQDVILNVTRKALSYIAEREKLVIRVAPDDLKILNDNRNFWEPVTDKLKDVIIEPDERVNRGSCIIESNSGTVDARLGVQMDEITELVEKMWTDNHLAEANGQS